MFFPNSEKAKLPKTHGRDIHASSSFRYIYLLSCLSKIYEDALVNLLKEFLYSHNALVPEKFGFRMPQLWNVSELIHFGCPMRKSLGGYI